MNKKQRIVIIIGILLVLISGLFPSYEGVDLTEKERYTIDIGYHFLFSPHLHARVAAEANPDMDFETARGAHTLNEAYHNVHIKTSKLMVQMSTIVLVTVGLVFFFSPKKQ
ncbi:MAG: hypothetical protein ACQESQ_11605 [Bacteroidota bacterium]